MSYKTIDTIIDNWADKYGLQVYKKYKDYEVRTVEIVDQNGNKYQIWIDPPDNNSKVNVYAWDYNNPQVDFNTTIAELNTVLEDIYQEVRNWINTKQRPK